ncbi:MAG TPA: hypothetical protein VFS05_10205 [Gemmatimonadaceae bacterium]|nr:hypothetical protein [Gemmatimonadaceae bacterium]
MSIPRIAGLGAFAAAAGLAALFALFVLFTRPTPTGGMDRTNAWVAWLSVGGIVLLLMAVHIVYGRVLLGMSRRG